MLFRKKIVVIGGTTGAGLLAAQAFLRQGALVVALGKNVETSTRAIEVLGKNAHVLTGDAAEEGSVEAAIDRCLERWEGFDGLCHATDDDGSYLGGSPLHKLTPEAWKKTLQPCLCSVMLSNRAAVRQFLQLGKGGAILNFCATPAHPFFAGPAHATAIAAVIGFTQSIAAFYAGENIRVNAITSSPIEAAMSPGALESEAAMWYSFYRQFPGGGRAALPKDFDSLASLLFSDAGAFITGQVIAVDGGFGNSDHGIF